MEKDSIEHWYLKETIGMPIEVISNENHYYF